jgi:hypothetical protein
MGEACDRLANECSRPTVLDIIPEFDQVVREMRRVTRPGGVVASGVFDFWGGFSASALVYDTGSVLDEGIRALRDDVRAHPLVRANVTTMLNSILSNRSPAI